MSGTAPSAAGLRDRIAELVAQYGLAPAALGKLESLVARLAEDPLAPTAVREPREIVDQHLADSLVALELEPVREARLALDLGSGAGLPGLPLAVALPRTAFVLLESSARKAAFLERTAQTCEIANARVVHARAEAYAEGVEHSDLVTARAVASLDVTLEYAAPLLRIGGTVVVWVGQRSSDRENAARRAGEELGLGGLEVTRVQPFPAARNRHLYVMSKVRETPARFPRRPGVALKRPLGAARRAPGPSA